MKKILTTLLISGISMYTYAQNTDGSELHRRTTEQKGNAYCPVYLTLSTGINNNTGLIGGNVEIPLTKNVSLAAGAGIGTWGGKLDIDARYYFNQIHRGWAVGLGLTYCTGISDYKTNMETIAGDNEDVDMNLHPQTNIFLAAYKYWQLNQKHTSQFYLELGFSVPLNSDKFEQIDGTPISDNSEKALKLLSPGGLIVGAGFTFGVGKSR